MTDLRQAAQQALEALEALKWKRSPSFVKGAITALRAALAEPENQSKSQADTKVNPAHGITEDSNE